MLALVQRRKMNDRWNLHFCQSSNKSCQHVFPRLCAPPKGYRASCSSPSQFSIQDMVNLNCVLPYVDFNSTGSEPAFNLALSSEIPAQPVAAILISLPRTSPCDPN